MGCASSTPIVIADPAKPEELMPIAAEEVPVLKSAPLSTEEVVPPAEVVATEEEKPVAKPSTAVMVAEPVAAMVEPAAEVVAPEVVATEVVAPEPPALAISEEVLASYKNVFDKDGSGAVSVSKLGEIMSAFGRIMSAEELNAMVKEVDADGSGKIGFDEFCTCMQKAKEGGATAPKLAAIIEENGLLAGIREFFGRFFDRDPSAEETAAAVAAAKAAADRQLAANLAANLDAERVYKTQKAAAIEAAAAEAAAAVKAAAEAAAAEAAAAKAAAAEMAAAEKAAAEAAAAEAAAAEAAAAEGIRGEGS
jgi:hypothetical protein